MAGYIFWGQVAQMWFLASRPQDQDIFWDFIILLDLSHESGENKNLFLKIGARVLELWLDMIFWVKLAQMQFLGPRLQGLEIFWEFIILLNSSHESWENEILFAKIGAKVLDLWLDTVKQSYFGWFLRFF